MEMAKPGPRSQREVIAHHLSAMIEDLRDWKLIPEDVASLRITVDLPYADRELDVWAVEMTLVGDLPFSLKLDNPITRKHLHNLEGGVN